MLKFSDSGQNQPKKKKSKLFKRKSRHSHRHKSTKDMMGESQAHMTSSDMSDHTSEGTSSLSSPEVPVSF